MLFNSFEFVLFIALFFAGWPLLRRTLRRNDSSGMEPEAFWAMKSEWGSQADIVLLGDSRTLVGVSPEAMQSGLPDVSIFNYAFQAVGSRRTTRPRTQVRAWRPTRRCLSPIRRGPARRDVTDLAAKIAADRSDTD